jgi:hypothetical protein
MSLQLARRIRMNRKALVRSSRLLHLVHDRRHTNDLLLGRDLQ